MVWETQPEGVLKSVVYVQQEQTSEVAHRLWFFSEKTAHPRSRTNGQRFSLVACSELNLR